MSSFKSEINALYAKHKKELQITIANYLNTSFKGYFEKYPAVKSVKINTAQSYNDNEYSDVVYCDRETIKINDYNCMDLDNEDWEDDEMVKNISLTRVQHEEIADEAAIIFANISEDILLHVYGNNFGLKVEPSGITLETSDIEMC